MTGGDDERGQLQERIDRLRSVLPAVAHELVNERRQASRLRAENARLVEQVRRLQTRTPTGASGSRPDGRGARVAAPHV